MINSNFRQRIAFRATSGYVMAPDLDQQYISAAPGEEGLGFDEKKRPLIAAAAGLFD